MSKTVEKIYKQLDVQNDINTVSGYAGVDKLNLLKEKYNNITLNFNDVLNTVPDSMQSFIKTKDSTKYLNGLSEKFKSNTINISVVAEVSSGKSTFLNALIFGKKVLDAKMGETTAKVFKISYGKNSDTDTLKEKIKEINSQTKDEISDKTFALEDIHVDDYIVDLKSDNENLKKGIVLYDTPGFGTLNEKVMLKLIKEAVNRSDAVILLLDISKGLKSDEAKFIKEALSYIKEDKRFIVLNKFDAAIDEDEDEDEIQTQIDKVVTDTKNELSKMSENIDKSLLDRQTYYLSAIKALSGKSKNKPENLEFSRFPIFEESFWQRIVEAKKETFEDNVKDLVNEGMIILSESNKQIDNFNAIITQTNSLVLNIEKVSIEIKAIVEEQSKIFNGLYIEIDKDTNIVYDKASLFEKNMKKIIKETSRKSLDSIPKDNVTEDDFKKAYKEAVEIINENFEKENSSFLNNISLDISQKENKVNEIIDTLNKEIEDEKFKELNLQEIPKIQYRNEANKNSKISVHDFEAKNSIQKEQTSEKGKDIISGVAIGNAIGLLLDSKANQGKDNTLASSATGATMGGGAGAAIGSVVPILGTAIGGAIGTAIGGIIGGVFGGGKKEAELKEAELKAEHEHAMRQIQEEHQKVMVEERYRNAVELAKRDFISELESITEEHIEDFISKNKRTIDNNYRTTLSQITSTIFNAKNILKEMQTIIEDPSEQKRVIKENEEKIQELNSFTQKIEQVFKV